MTRALVVLNSKQDRERAAKWVWLAPSKCRVEFKGTKRSVPQNSRFWAMLTDIAQQKEHCGRKYTPDQWKVIFMHACGREVQFIPSLDNKTFIPWGQRSSDLGKDEMSELIDFIAAWGAENHVHFNDPAESSVPAPLNSPEVSAASQSNPQVKPAPAMDEESAKGAGISQSTDGTGPAEHEVRPAVEDRQATESGASALHGSGGLPEGWEREYAKALGKATKPHSLSKYATAWWAPHGGWVAHKSGPNAATASAIYDAYANYFGDAGKEARETILHELGAAP